MYTYMKLIFITWAGNCL